MKPNLAACIAVRLKNRLTEIKGFWRRFFATAFNPYRPELHYMRGPGPAWRAKHGMDAPLRLKPRDL